MTSRIPEPDSELEREGIPDMGDTLPSKQITGDAQEGYPAPRDHAVAADDFGTTAAEQARGEGLTDRLRRELPDVPERDVPGEQDGPGGAGQSAADGPGGPGGPGGVGRISEDQDALLRDKDTDMFATDRGTAGGGFSAEESAMHVIEEP